MLRNRTAVMLFFIGRKRKLRYFSVLTDSNTQRVRENLIEKALDRETGDFVCLQILFHQYRRCLASYYS